MNNLKNTGKILSLVGLLGGCAGNVPQGRITMDHIREKHQEVMDRFNCKDSRVVDFGHGYFGPKNGTGAMAYLKSLFEENIRVGAKRESTENTKESKIIAKANLSLRDYPIELLRDVDRNGDYIIEPREVNELNKEVHNYVLNSILGQE
jgi:hypothetical protein